MNAKYPVALQISQNMKMSIESMTLKIDNRIDQRQRISESQRD